MDIKFLTVELAVAKSVFSKIIWRVYENWQMRVGKATPTMTIRSKAAPGTTVDLGRLPLFAPT
jgi:hypothetical protein